MKPNNPLLLSLALSSAIFVTACNPDRDETPAADVAADQPAPAVEPAPAPPPMQEPAAPAPATAAAVDSGMPFTVMDKNADGGITQDELASTEMLHQHFTQADTDGDGKLSEAEVDKHRAEMGG